MRNRILAAATLTGLLVAAGIATAGTASAASHGDCTYTSRTPTLRTGTNDPAAVKQLQCELNHVMVGEFNPQLDVDGKFGQHTRDAVVQFQGLAGFQGSQVDGVVGPKTWGTLDGLFTAGLPVN